MNAFDVRGNEGGEKEGERGRGGGSGERYILGVGVLWHDCQMNRRRVLLSFNFPSLRFFHYIADGHDVNLTMRERPARSGNEWKKGREGR